MTPPPQAVLDRALQKFRLRSGTLPFARPRTRPVWLPLGGEVRPRRWT
jgi:hypothetical protein